VIEPAIGLQPGEGPVDHAEQQHRHRLVKLGPFEPRPYGGHRVGESSDQPALRLQHRLALGIAQELHVFGQDTVFVLGQRVGLHEACDQRAQVRLGGQAFGDHLGLHGQQPLHMRVCNLCQQVVLIANVVVQRGLADATRGGQVEHRGGGIAAHGEEFRRGVQDLLALAVVTGGTRAGHRRCSAACFSARRS